MRTQTFSTLVLLGLATLTAPALSAPLSGGASDGGAIQGGDGAPGSGVGIPGAIVNDTTAEGIGEDSTVDPNPRTEAYQALAVRRIEGDAQFGRPVPRFRYRIVPRDAF